MNQVTLVARSKSSTSASADDFLSLPEDARDQFLRIRTREQQLDVLEAWVKHEDFRLTDAFLLSEPYRQMCVDLVAGASHKGMQPLSKNFILAPRYKGDEVFFENGTRRNQRIHAKIVKPQVIPATQACHLMMSFGPSAPADVNKDRLIELSSESEWSPEPMPALVREVFGRPESPASEIPAGAKAPAKK